ncbi:hypothetical protein E3N88_33145 [Mikania micrantha]|uniref:Uncharacterized protein n=1 Tax=Mikania micrantha TaxID=192012 RepID=A0A5N6MAF1_9ASTR|nr:hypothetical protein E3N88_33145 [Mikania micrantha]
MIFERHRPRSSRKCDNEVPAAVGQNLSTASCERTGISPVQEQAEVLCKNRPADCVSPVKEILCMYKLSTSGWIETVDFGQQ